MSYKTPDALLLLAPGCAYCPRVLAGLSQLLEQGRLGRLDAINIQAHPDAASQRGVRSVPWCQIGPFELMGAQTLGELSAWTEHAAQGDGWGTYYRHLLETQRPHQVTQAIRIRPSTLQELLALLGQEDNPMAVKLGIGVVIEELQGEPLLGQALPGLERLAGLQDAATRADAAHYLGLTGDPRAIPVLQRLLQDEHPDVREIAAESLELLNRGADEP